ncbi:MAG: hypothetical protein J6A89_03010 [Clostridia bacterium]|nr:hypothetical protein [Clostridia bacterium]
MSKNKRIISGAKTSGKFAAILSAAILVLQLTACSNSKPIEEVKTEIEFCDTSDIALYNYIDKYKEDYKDGNVSNGIEMYTYYKELYDFLKLDPITKTDNSEAFQYSEAQIINTTYNFNKDTMVYDTLENGIYYVNGEVIKKVESDSVQLKTLYGNIKIENLDESYFITNIDDENSIKTVIQYNSDGSWTISEDANKKSEIFQFNNDGILVSSDTIKHVDDNNTIRKVYNNGNINFYDAYDQHSNLVEKRKVDGSYMIVGHINIDKNRYNFYPDSNTYYDEILYYYDENDNLQNIKAYEKSLHNDGSYTENSTIFFPNGDYYKYIQYYNANGNLYKNEKIENKYNQYKTSILEEQNENGETNVIVNKWDYNINGGIGDCIYRKINNVITIKQKDGIIYQYSQQDGKFYDAYKVQKDGIMYYREDGSKLCFEKKNGTKIGYDEKGNINSITNDAIFTGYYNYDENVISYISNKSDCEITVNANGKKFELSPTGYVSFYENGNTNTYYYDEKTSSNYLETGEEWCSEKDGITTFYDTNHNITGIIKDDIRTDYYDYDNNVIQAIESKGIRYTYYENGNIKKVENLTNEDLLNFNGYELIKGSYISYYENDNLQKYYYDKDYSIEYYETGEEWKVDQDNRKIIYDKEHNVTAMWENKSNDGFYTLYTEYYDYDNNIIKSIQEDSVVTNYYKNQEIENIYNYNDEGVVVAVNDIYGNVYQLNKDDYIRFNKDGFISSVKQGNDIKVCWRNDTQEYFYVKNENDNTYTFYHNDEILYITDNADSFKRTVFNNDNGRVRIVLEDGTIIDPDIQGEMTENKQIEPKEEKSDDYEER